MRRCCWAIGLSVWGLLASAIPSSVWAQNPIPVGDDRSTYVQFCRDLLKFHLQSADVYRQHTKDPAGVQADAVKFIEGFSRCLLGKRLAFNMAELKARGERVIQQGSTDPLVATFCASAECYVNPPPPEYKRIMPQEEKLWKCYHELQKSTYPRYWKLLPLVLMPKGWVLRVPGERSAQDWLAELTSALLSDDVFTEEQQRMRFDAMMFVFEKLDIEHKKIFQETCEKHAEVDPWINAMVAGQYFLDRAWFHRGSGYAPQVTEEGWTQFRQHLRTGAEYLVNAWQINPDNPESATEMISVAMATSDENQGTTREWFDRAVKAEMDYPEAYSRYLWSSRPRWGGSHEKMLKFGLECAATNRYDTDVPYMLISAIVSINEESERRYAVCKDPQVYAALEKTLLNMLADPAHQQPESFLRTTVIMQTRLLAVAFHTRHFDVARKILDSGEGGKITVNTAIIRNEGLLTGKTFATVFAGSGPAADKVEKYLALYDEKNRLGEADRQQAVQWLQEGAKLETNPRGAIFFRHHLKILEWEAAFDAGECVTLTFDKDLSGWLKPAGNWTPEGDDAVVGKSENGKAKIELHCAAYFSEPFELVADITMLKPVNDNVMVGLVVGHKEVNGDDEPINRAYWIQALQKQGGVSRSDFILSKDGQFEPWDSGETSQLRVKLWPDQFEYLINYHRNKNTTFPGYTLNGRVGLATFQAISPETKVRFQQVKIRKLTRPVPPPDDQPAAQVAYFTESIREDDKDSSSWVRRGQAYIKLGEYDKAQTDYEAAVMLFQGDGEYYRTLARIAGHRNNTPAMFDFYEKATTVNLMKSRTYGYEVAWIRATHPDPKYRNGQSAMAVVERGAKLKWNSGWLAKRTEAAVYAEVGDFTKAREAMALAIEKAPEEQRDQLRKYADQLAKQQPLTDASFGEDAEKAVSKP